MVKHVKLACAVLLFIVSGCGSQPASPTDTASAQESVPVHESEIDPQGVNGLVTFLARNDCAEMRREAFMACYERTRLRLIQTTQSLEEAEYRISQLSTRKGKVL